MDRLVRLEAVDKTTLCHNGDADRRRAKAVSRYILGLGRLNPRLYTVFVPKETEANEVQRVFQKGAIGELTNLAWRYARPQHLHFYCAPLGYDGRELAVVAAGWARMSPLPIEVPDGWGTSRFRTGWD